MPPLAPVTTNRRPSCRGTSRQRSVLTPGGERALDVLDGVAERDRATDGAEPVLDLLDRPRHHVAGRVAALAGREGHVEGDLELHHVGAALVADLVALGPGREGLERRALAGDVVEVDGAAADQRGQQQLDRREVGVVAGADGHAAAPLVGGHPAVLADLVEVDAAVGLGSGLGCHGGQPARARPGDTPGSAYPLILGAVPGCVEVRDSLPPHTRRTPCLMGAGSVAGRPSAGRPPDHRADRGDAAAVGSGGVGVSCVRPCGPRARGGADARAG